MALASLGGTDQITISGPHPAWCTAGAHWDPALLPTPFLPSPDSLVCFCCRHHISLQEWLCEWQPTTPVSHRAGPFPEPGPEFCFTPSLGTKHLSCFSVMTERHRVLKALRVNWAVDTMGQARLPQRSDVRLSHADPGPLSPARRTRVNRGWVMGRRG